MGCSRSFWTALFVRFYCTVYPRASRHAMRAFWNDACPACCCCETASSCGKATLRGESRCTVAPATAPPGVAVPASRPIIAAAAAPAAGCTEVPRAPATAASPASRRVDVPAAPLRIRRLLPAVGVGGEASGASHGLAGSNPLCCTDQAKHWASSFFCCSGDCFLIACMSCCASVGTASVEVARHATRICDFLDIGFLPSFVSPSNLRVNGQSQQKADARQ